MHLEDSTLPLSSCYATDMSTLFEFQSKIFMIYNGNGYGRTGLGYATLKVEADQLVKVLVQKQLLNYF
jgi:hypothetical protein